ncbi:hypothetical protein SEA_MAIH_63 [Streptomyces phage Maih]|uniref:Uncharacterized protein n=3 Tax=Woodruffvirus TP1604 TaxID=1982746 RepID=A0A1P8VW24_9CAUD|nr:hypothetical protein AVT62_gp64 [Streptomyces phage TP1604]AKA61802.1 hypothetical protein SEA_TP1604_64 [Streptomyces phage TP1604]ALY07313.1 hypothetical protein SEA_MAIH_63 [Streptomyces phage Maih]APZ82233.1 hypothetical protein SEA_BABYGOTBAC_65 [Streptomyces phage BabyGotBac]USH45440.1 hypothetical protein SEA_ASIS_65 [Streptomyces phage Asis]
MMARESGSGVRCAHETSRGYGCLNQAKGGPFCPGHDPRNQCGRLTLAGTACKRRATATGGPCTKHS